MKHVFHIHSFTCYITSVGVVKMEDIPMNDVIFVIYRSIPKIFTEVKHIYIPDNKYYFPYFTNKKLFNFSFLLTKKYIKYFDNIIYNEIGNDYIFYVHNSRGYLYRIFITNNFCKEVRFIEDGLDAYFTEQAFYKKYPYIVKLRHKIVNYLLGNILGSEYVYNRLKQFDNPFKNKKEIPRFYGLTNDSFSKFLPEKCDYIKINQDIIKDIQEYKVPDGSNVFVFSALIEQYVTTQDILDKFIEWYVMFFKINKVFINFHPHQSVLSRDKIINKLKDENVDIHIIPDDIIMETFFINNKKLNIYGIGTSLLVYASYFSTSSKVYVLYPFFKLNLKLDTIRTKFWDDTYQNMHLKNLYLYGREFNDDCIG